MAIPDAVGGADRSALRNTETSSSLEESLGSILPSTAGRGFASLQPGPRCPMAPVAPLDWRATPDPDLLGSSGPDAELVAARRK